MLELAQAMILRPTRYSILAKHAVGELDWLTVAFPMEVDEVYGELPRCAAGALQSLVPGTHRNYRELLPPLTYLLRC